MKVPTVCLIGESNSGKTTIMKRLVAGLKLRGYHVATVKHAPHGFDFDYPGKDSWHYARAGSDMVILSSPHQIALSKHVDVDTSPEDLWRLIGHDFDIVLAEGFKKSRLPKIQVLRDAWSDELLCPEEELLAVVAGRSSAYAYNVPRFLPEDTSGLIQLIEDKLLSSRGANTAAVLMYANGVPIPMTDFVQSMFARTLRGMLSSLRGVPELPQTIDISVRFSKSTSQGEGDPSMNALRKLPEMVPEPAKLAPAV